MRPLAEEVADFFGSGIRHNLARFPPESAQSAFVEFEISIHDLQEFLGRFGGWRS